MGDKLARFWCLGILVGMSIAATLHAQPAEIASVSRKIDAEISQRLAKEKIQPAGRADHARLVRRLYLDVLGRIPTATEAAAYRADPSPEKHHRLIDQLVAHPEMPVYWRKVIDGWLNGPLDRQSRSFGHDDFLKWMEQSIEKDKSWNRIAKELVLPDDADPNQRGAAHFLASRLQGEKVAQLDSIATSVASGLFGVQLQCAKCHDHPFVDEWKQDHYYGLAAFFNRLETKNANGKSTLIEKDVGEVKFTTRKKGDKIAVAMFLDSVVLDKAAAKSEKGPSRRVLLVEHALKPESPYFKRAFVNRMWK